MEIIMIITLSFLVLCIIFCLIMLYRNNLVLDARAKALDIVSERAKEALKNGDYDWMRFHRVLDNPSYDKMFWDFRKWSYESFYDFIEDVK